MFHWMMDVSDPIVVAMSSQRKTVPEKHRPPDLAELLQTSELDLSQNSNISETQDDSFFPDDDQEEATSDFKISISNDVDMSSDME